MKKFALLALLACVAFVGCKDENAKPGSTSASGTPTATATGTK